MKNNAFATLIKDVLMAVIAWGIGWMLLKSGFAMDNSAAMAVAFYAACIPFGWRWASKIITAVSLYGIGLKLLISLLLGMFAIFIVLGVDVVKCIAALFSAGVRGVRRTETAETC